MIVGDRARLTMERSLRHRDLTRPYRLAGMLLVVGLLSAGVLLLHLVAASVGHPLMVDPITGMGRDLALLESSRFGAFALTMAHTYVVAMALAGAAAFMVAERRHARRDAARAHAHRAEGSCQRVEQLSGGELRHLFLTRTMLYAGIILLSVLAQDLYLRLVDNSATLGLASLAVPDIALISLALVVAAIAAVSSLQGLGTLTLLREWRVALRDMLLKRAHAQRSRARTQAPRRCLRRPPQLIFGDDVLSRPPPAGGLGRAVTPDREVTAQAR